MAAVLLISCSASKTKRDIASSERPPQFVLLAFDGSKSLPMWDETMAFAQEVPVRFTYFISGVYFLSPAHKTIYKAPGYRAGRSAIGWGKGESDISQRARKIKEALSRGHEIASHANGHWDGSGWSQSQWTDELNQFDQILLDAPDRYNILRVRGERFWPDYFNKEQIGFRAPLLGVSSGLFRALADKGYKYDTSRIDKMAYWPQKINGVWNFPLASVRQARSGKNTLSMDYNFYYADSKGQRGDASLYQYYEDQMFETYMNYFEHNYFGNRAPIDIGHHFSKWNGGAYWRAMKRFARAVCNQPEVRCVTYSELVDYLESVGAPKLASFSEGKFAPMDRRYANLPVIPKRVGLKSGELSDEEIEALRKSLKDMDFNHDDEDSVIDL